MHLVKVRNADGFSRLVAVKLLKAQWSGSEDVTRRMRDEARLLGLLRHRNIVDVMDLTRIDGRAAVVMEYLEGIDLKQLNEELCRAGKLLPARPALEVAAAVAGALDAAYNRPPMPGEKPLRVIHRDIKPSNVMVDESARVKVLDFGVARSDLEGRESDTQELQYGSVDYMAPERLFFEPETPSSDVYSLGATLFELLTGETLGKARGRPARHAQHLDARFGLLPEVPGASAEFSTALVSLLREALAFDLDERPTAAEFYQRARTLARLAPGDDLSAWCEQELASLVPRVLEERRSPSPLDDTVLLEDSTPSWGAQPAQRPAGPTGDALRRGALAELEASLDQAQALPPPHPSLHAVGHPSGAPGEPDPEEAWEDGPTELAFARETPDLAAVLDGLDAPLDTEEAVRRTARGAAAREVPPDPADPFAVLTEVSAPRGEPGVAVRDRPVPVPLAPTPSARGRMPQICAVDTVPDLDLDAPLAPASAPGPEARRLPSGIGPVSVDPTEDATDVLAMPPLPSSNTEAGGVSVASSQPPSATPGANGCLANQEPEEATESGGGDVVGQPSITQAAPEDTVVSSVLAGSIVEDDDEDPWPADTSTREPPGRPRWTRARGAVAALVVVFGLVGVAAGGVCVWFVVGDGAPSASGPLADASAGGGPAGDGAVGGAAAKTAASADPAAPALVFRSSLENVRKLRVQCDIGSGKGVTEAVVVGAAADRCTVTAILDDRSRRTAVVEAPEAGVYQCFDGDSGCQVL